MTHTTKSNIFVPTQGQCTQPLKSKSELNRLPIWCSLRNQNWINNRSLQSYYLILSILKVDIFAFSVKDRFLFILSQWNPLWSVDPLYGLTLCPLPPPQTAKKSLALKRRFCIRTLLHIPVTHYCFSLACRWSAGAVELHCELGLEAAQWDDGALTPSPDRSQPTLLTMHTHKILARKHNSVSQNYSDSNTNSGNHEESIANTSNGS